ncbi:MAG: hypothetical protein IJF97_00870, partial [Eggerthellaceae bacterium]|nr:hypothetical protein [Eggerthellaceae bacterium]
SSIYTQKRIIRKNRRSDRVLMEQRRESDEIARIAGELIDSSPELRHVKRSKARIAYLASDREKTSRRRTVFAECERVPAKYRWAVPYDFTITVYEPNVERFTDEQMRVLVLHELMHVGVDVDGNEELYYVVPHDVEEFRGIIERYGMDWCL